jgi:hypothetical protein
MDQTRGRDLLTGGKMLNCSIRGSLTTSISHEYDKCGTENRAFHMALA